MSVATRCPSCGTVFRVVPDQLKVSDGWVRCGRCTEVFNASQRLFDLDQQSPPASAPATPLPSAEVRQLHGLVRMGPALAPPSAPKPQHDAEAEATAAPEPAQPPPAEATHEATHEAQTVASAPAEAPPESTNAPAAPAEPAPEFVRRADRAARWRQPGRRGLLAGAALLLALLLAGQIALHYRDLLAANSPGTRSLLRAACGLLGCRIEPPRRIDSLHVDSSGLVHLQDSALYRLSLVVQNKAPMEVRMPAVDLVITDAQGQTTARRVLTSAELGQPADRLAAGAEAALQATLDLGELRVAGYTVELFYP